MELSKRRFPTGFTLVELLAVIAILALLLAIIVPGLKKARLAAKQVVCAAQMKQWALACLAYTAEHDNTVVPYGDVRDMTKAGNALDTDTYWYNRLGLYLTRESYGTWGMDYEIRRCPLGRTGWGDDAVWVGVYYGLHSPEKAPFVFPYIWQNSCLTKLCTAPKMSTLKTPANYLMMLDVRRDRVQNPMTWKWDVDYDGDGIIDSNLGTLTVNLSPYNWAQPKIHRNGCNVALFDGHVEWISYKDFWEFGSDGYPLHRYWFNKNRP